jgi:hypothetical protein
MVKTYWAMECLSKCMQPNGNTIRQF